VLRRPIETTRLLGMWGAASDYGELTNAYSLDGWLGRSLVIFSSASRKLASYPNGAALSARLALKISDRLTKRKRAIGS